MNTTTLPARPLCYTTELKSASPLTIIAPAGSEGQKTAEILREALLGYAAQVVVRPDDDPTLLYNAQAPIFLIGNLADNKCVEELYYRLLCITDKRYPGPGGFELRTLLNPLGSGHNIIHLGYSDGTGLQKALNCLLGKIAATIPFLREIEANQLPLSKEEVATFRDEELPFDQEDRVLAQLRVVSSKGYLAYLTGEEKPLQDYLKAWEVMVKLDPEQDINHLVSTFHVAVWRLLEPSGIFPESMREPMVNFIFRLINGKEGRHLVLTGDIRDVPKQNHWLIPSMKLIWGADYFKTHYPELKEPGEWEKIAHDYFRPYLNGSWKPICDGSTMVFTHSQPPMMEFALMDREHRFMKTGAFKKFVDNAVAMVNNQGWLPIAGVSTLAMAFPGYCLRLAAQYYKDGRYRFVHDTADEVISLRQTAVPFRTFDIGVEPVKPTDMTGLTVIPLDPIGYNYHKTENSPPEEICFDKLSIRSGWDYDDDYLLVDGLGAGGHSFNDAMGIFDYSRHGITFIVQEDNEERPEPDNKSTLTIVRNGEAGTIPILAELLDQKTSNKGQTYVCMRLANYNGTDWIREIHLLAGKCLIVHDTVIVNTDGDYVIEDRFNIPGEGALDNNTFTCRRSRPEQEEVHFSLTGFCSTNHLVSQEAMEVVGQIYSASTKYIDTKKMWRERYHVDKNRMTCFTSKVARPLKKGDSVDFTHVICPRKSHEKVEVSWENQTTLNIDWNGATIGLPFAYKGKINEPAEANGHACAPRPVAAEDAICKKLTSLDDKISDIKRCQNGDILCRTSSNDVHIFNSSWEIQSKISFDRDIRDFDLLAGPNSNLVIAFADGFLAAFDRKGQRLWQVEIQTVGDEFAPSWKFEPSKIVKVVAYTSQGKDYIVIGCKDFSLRQFSGGGEPLWTYYDATDTPKHDVLVRKTITGIPGHISIADVDQDGELEILVAPGRESQGWDSNCYVISHEGRTKKVLPGEGWTSYVTALQCKSMGNYNVLACGANHWKNLKAFKVYHQNGEDQYEQIIEKRLGGQVTHLELIPPQEMLFAGTSKGILLAYDFMGNRQWLKTFESGIKHLYSLNERLIVNENNGQTHLFTTEGNSTAISRAGLPWEHFMVQEGQLFFSSGKSIYQLTRIFHHQGSS